MFGKNSRETVTALYVWAIIFLGAGLLAFAILSDAHLARRVQAEWHGLLAFFALGILLQLTQQKLAVGSAFGSIAFIVYLGSVLVFGAALGTLVTAASLTTAHVAQTKPPLKIAFNVAQHALAVLSGGVLYSSLGGVVPLESLDRSVVPFVGLVVGFFAVNSTAVSLVVALSEHRRFDEVWLRNTWSWVGYDLVASALALGIAWLYLSLGLVGMALVVLPILFLRHAYLVNTQLQATNRELLELMVKAIEARDPYTSGHSERVARVARLLAEQMGLSLREVDKIETAALLHDVGKIYEEFAPILRKNGKLTSEERRIMESHAVRGAELVATISNLRGYVERCVRHHHENFDGTGYPSGLCGEQIPVGARIILVADTTDAMTTDRPYRKAVSYQRLVEELDKYSGVQFDPSVVTAFKKSAAIRRFVLEAQQRLAPVPGSEDGAVVQLVER
jgi:putative nucleotidyltransferase with HDIG domain